MGLLSGLVTLPLAPVRGVVWVAQTIEEAAEDQLYDPAVVRAELAALQRDLEDGLIDEESYEREEDALLDRLERRATGQGPGGPGSTGTTGTWPGTPGKGKEFR